MSPYDKQVYDAGFKYVPKSEFLLNPFQIPQDGGGGATAPTQPGLPSINISGGGGGGAAYTGGIRGLTTDFQKAVDARQNRLTELNRPLTTSTMLGMNSLNQKVMDYIRANPTKKFPVDEFSKMSFDKQLNRYTDAEFMKANPELFPDESFPGAFQEKPTLNRKIQDAIYSTPFFNKPQSADQIMEEGYTPGVNLGILSNILGKADKFGTLSRPDQAFITSQMGYTGPTVFGENTTGGSKDPFGLNVRSAFGNYAERVGKEATKLDSLLNEKMTKKYGKGTSGITFNDATGEFEAIDDEDENAIDAALKATQMNKMNITKLNFYRNKVKERDDFRRQEEERIAQEEAEAARVAANARQAAFDQARKDREKYADVEAAISRGDRVDDRDRPSSGPTAVGAGMGVGGGYASDYGFLKDGGRVYYMDGGLADLVDIYD